MAVNEQFKRGRNIWNTFQLSERSERISATHSEIQNSNIWKKTIHDQMKLQFSYQENCRTTGTNSKHES